MQVRPLVILALITADAPACSRPTVYERAESIAALPGVPPAPNFYNLVDYRYWVDDLLGK